MATLTYNDKQILKYKKKARQNEQKFSKTKDKLFLWKADELLTKANKLSENETVDRERMKRKVKASKKTDDQLINEAMRQNRRERNAAEEAMKEREKKQKEIEDRRNRVKMNIKKKKEEQETTEKEMKEGCEKYTKSINEYKEKFLKEYIEENPKSSDSLAQKEFVRHYKKQIEFLEWKTKMINLFTSIGMSETEAEEHLEKMIKESKEKRDEECGQGGLDDKEDTTVKINLNPSL